MDNQIVELIGENGKKLFFYLDAELEYDGYSYQILTPKDDSMGLNPDEALVFRIENGEYFLEENDDIINEIENLYNNEQ